MVPHHAVADGFKYLRQSELRDEETEGSAAGLVFGHDVRPGAWPARHQTHALQVVHSLGDGDAGCIEEFAQLRFAGKAVARLSSPD